MPNRWVNISHHPFKAGERDASLIVLEDTTEQKLDRELQKESHKLRGEILENLPDAILLLDRDLRIQWVNDTVTKFFGGISFLVKTL